ncbi:MAG: type II toxin-antitoxin system HicA family toxin [Coriobacteriales bacterium]|jgi:hypothetical protein|nr:type II toxin-antitoxin system HicA family toxin [Coriobacteriales bacterium]
MSQIEKLIEQLKTRPDAFKYQDMKKVLKHLGYSELIGGKTSGSRIRFMSATHPPISLHRPHPGNEVKAYVIKDVTQFLEDEGLI